MADLAATDVTITVQDRWIDGRKRWGLVKITFGDGVKTYPAGGVPLPAKDKFGMVRSLDSVIVTDSDDSTGLMWKWDKETNKLRGYWPTGGGGATLTPAASTPILSAGATAVTASAATGPFTPGQGKEFVSATTTIAAQTMYAKVCGW